VKRDDLEFGQRVKVYADVWRFMGPRWNPKWPRTDFGRYIENLGCASGKCKRNVEKLPGDPMWGPPTRFAGKFDEEPDNGGTQFIRFRRIRAIQYPAIVAGVVTKYEGRIELESREDGGNYFIQQRRLQLVELLPAHQPLTTKPKFTLALPEDFELE
jgi:hypothetical protein